MKRKHGAPPAPVPTPEEIKERAEIERAESLEMKRMEVHKTPPPVRQYRPYSLWR